VSFRFGKAEDVIPDLLKTISGKPVAIVDPPRGGLRK